jgi:hypothetical protein
MHQMQKNPNRSKWIKWSLNHLFQGLNVELLGFPTTAGRIRGSCGRPFGRPLPFFRGVKGRLAALSVAGDSWSLMDTPGKHTKNYGKSQVLMGKSTNHMFIFKSYVSLPEGMLYSWRLYWRLMGIHRYWWRTWISIGNIMDMNGIHQPYSAWLSNIRCD